jgi:hypothetical protein
MPRRTRHPHILTTNLRPEFAAEVLVAVKANGLTVSAALREALQLWLRAEG